MHDLFTKKLRLKIKNKVDNSATNQSCVTQETITKLTEKLMSHSERKQWHTLISMVSSTLSSPPHQTRESPHQEIIRIRSPGHLFLKVFITYSLHIDFLPRKHSCQVLGKWMRDIWYGSTILGGATMVGADAPEKFWDFWRSRLAKNASICVRRGGRKRLFPPLPIFLHGWNIKTRQ